MSLSNLPPGCPSSKKINIEFKCEMCGTIFDLPATWDMGSTFLDGDIICPNCNNDDEELMSDF